MRRNCGCKNDSKQARRLVLRKLHDSRVVDDNKTINIGIVFHICYKNYDKVTIGSDIAYTIDMLNKDYNKLCSNFDYGRGKYTNSDYVATYDSYVQLAAACNINFYLVDIKYNVIAAQTSSNTSVLDYNIKNASVPVSPDKYLNVWIVDMSNGLLGYAQFPWENSPQTDGVVIAKGTFGKYPEYDEYDLNKTMTHEVGHWLGLYHTFQETFEYEGGNIDYVDGNDVEETKGDCVIDTPPQAQPTYGNPFATPTVWPSSKPADEPKSFRHMFMNFMDYSDDIALYMFTKDQVTKIRQMIHIYRPNIISNEVVTVPPPPVLPPSPIFTTAIYDFDTKPIGWVSDIVLSGNSTLTPRSSIIVSEHAYSGTKCLATRYIGKAEFEVNLSGVKQAQLTVWALSLNSSTYIWLKPPNSSTWYSVKLANYGYYHKYTINIPGSLESINNTNYKIRIGTNSISSTYSYFDNVSVANVSV